MAFKVEDEYRTSELSLRPGGYTVVVIYNVYPQIREYDKIKKPYAYISKFDGDPRVIKAYVKKEK